MNAIPCTKFVSCCLMLTGVFMTGSGVASAQEDSTLNIPPMAGSNRPANVPYEYVITPYGYFHPSCVQSLAKAEEVRADGRIKHADGSIEEKAAVCRYPRYTHKGLPVTTGPAKTSTPEENGTGANVVPEASGWLENANTTTGSAKKSYGALTATWTVPPHPATNDGQVLFLFPGLEDINAVQSILQPVLQWYQGQWAIASWNCCLSNIITSSPLVNVNPGDQISGSITMTCRAGTLSCATWNVVTTDLTTGKSTALRSTPSDGQVFNWAFGGVLEPYYAIACEDYPGNQKISFNNIQVFDQNLSRVANPAWTETSNSTLTPQCSYGVHTGTSAVTVSY